MLERQTARHDRCLDATVLETRCRTDQLPAVSLFGGCLDVHGGERRNSFTRDVRRFEHRAQQFIRQDDHLQPHVVTFNISGRIGLGVTKRLRLFNRLGKAEPSLHATEDEV
ncbi:hypothetical protein D9M69_519450 [compost metagenome]